MNRATYWLTLGIIIVFTVLFNLFGKRQVGVSEVLLLFICVPRLHDVGKSGWWAGGFFLGELALLALSFATLPLIYATIPMGLYVLIVGGLMIWLGTMPGDPAANRFGEPPPPGIGLARPKKVTPA
jgi:uncharacterized membrane protein YhaH (DUF805 family)